MEKCGIYCWTNITNNKKYIGLSKDIDKRWIKHIQNANLGVKGKFYNAVRKYGESTFIKEILEICDINISNNDLLEKEKTYILKFDTLKNGYNTVLDYGNTITYNPNKIDIGNKISKIKKELNKSWIYKGNKTKCINADKLDTFLQNGWIIGRIEFTQIHKDNISTVLKDKWKNGYTHKPEALEIMSNTFKGKKHTEETKEQMRNKSKDKYTLDWFINKYSETLGSQKYIEKCQKLKDRKMATGLNWFISRYGEIDGLKWFTYKEENMKNRYYTWVNNHIDMVIIKRSEKKKYIEEGWFIGMLKNNKY